MNFYKHHIGDYAQATAHLSFVEDAAYSRLIRKYYAEERPIPSDFKAAQRLIGARTREEKQAVEDILKEFFTLEADGWHNKRCDAEIEANRELDADREAKNANEKERQRRHREERSKLFEGLRDLNIIPPYDTKTETLRKLLANALVTPPVTRDERRMSQPVTPPVTRNATANQTPDTRRQTPVLKTGETTTYSTDSSPPPTPPAVVDPITHRAIELSVLLRKGGAALTASDPNVRRWAETGVSDAQALTALEAAQRQRADSCSLQPINSGLLNAIIYGTVATHKSRADQHSETLAALTGKGKKRNEPIDITPARTTSGALD